MNRPEVAAWFGFVRVVGTFLEYRAALTPATARGTSDTTPAVGPGAALGGGELPRQSLESTQLASYCSWLGFLFGLSLALEVAVGLIKSAPAS